jgi:hypothetical protein
MAKPRTRNPEPLNLIEKNGNRGATTNGGIGSGFRTLRYREAPE